MMHNRFLAKCGVSFACLVSVWGMGAYAKTTELFRFPVNIPAGTNGADGCSAKVTAASNGCTNITERALDTNGNCQDTSNVRTVCPGKQGNSCTIKSVSTVDNAQKVTFNCGDPDDDTEITIPNGQGCAVSRVDTTATGKNIIMACGNSSTTIPVENGTNCNLTVATDSTTRNVSVTKSCGNETPTTVQILNHQNLVNDAATATANKIIQDGTFATTQQLNTANSAISDLQSGKVDLTIHNAFVTSTNAALENKVDQDDFDSAMSDVYDKDYIDGKVTELNASITSAAAGVSEERLSELISQTVNGQYATATAFNTLADTVNNKLNKDQLATELGKTANTNAVNTIINNNSTVTDLQSTLSTVQTTANNALPAANFGTTLKSSAQSSNLATALAATAPTATINGIIDTNSTVAGKASQSALDTLAGRVTANETAIAALPNEDRVAQIAANAANAAALCAGGRIETQESTEGGKTVIHVNCVTDD